MMEVKKYAEPRQNRANICFDCQRAYGGCSWSARDLETGELLFMPVPGWTAEPSLLYKSRNYHKKETWTYRITACPLFLRDVRKA